MNRAPSRILALTVMVALVFMTGAASGFDSSLVEEIRLSPEAPFTLVPAAAFEQEGQHLVAFVHVEPAGHATPIFTVERPDGERVMFVRVVDRAAYVTDGLHEDGTVRYVEVEGKFIEPHHHLYEVTLHGDTYTLSIDQHARVTARTFASATTGRLGAAPLDAMPLPHEPVDVSQARWTSSPLARLHTFTAAPEAHGWEVLDASGTRVHVNTGKLGDRSRGELEIDASTLPGVAYVRTPLAGFDGHFVAEGAARSMSAISPPQPQAVVAGVSGPSDAPTVNWAVILDRVVPILEDTTMPDEWSFYFLGPDGTRTKVGDNWLALAHHHVRVIVDEPADRIDVIVDGAADALRFEGLGIGTSTFVATGDLTDGLRLAPGQARSVQYDNLSVYPLLPGGP